MKIINIASGNSVWRGLDYYNDKKVKNYKQLDKFRYSGKVVGSNNKKYDVVLDLEHPRNSKCNCPHANGKKVICKHIVALYFTVFPKDVDKFLKKVEESQKGYEEYEKDLYMKVVNKIQTMSRSELEEALTFILNYAPDWVYERFVRDYVELN